MRAPTAALRSLSLLILAACAPMGTPQLPCLDDACPGASKKGQGAHARDASGPDYGILSLNLHCLFTSGTPYASNEARFEAIADAVLADDIAVLAVQEACHGAEESAMPMLQAALEDATGSSWSTAWAYAHQGWEGTPDEVAEGVGVLYRGTGGEDFEYAYYAQGPLRRALVAVTLPAELGGLTVASVHLDYADRDIREAQARETASVLLSAFASTELVIAGDLNDDEGSETHDAFLEQGFIDLTTRLSSSRIDHIFAHRGASLVHDGEARMFDGRSTAVVSDHDGYAVWVGPGTGDPVSLTRLVANVDAGWGNHLTVRGDTAPLDWDRGQMAYPISDYRWRLVSSELGAGDIEYKWLLNDQDWQRGWNSEASAGSDAETWPVF